MMKNEKVSFGTHAAGAVLGITGTVLLLIKNTREVMELPLAVYGLSVVFLFTASSLYHWMKKGENEDTIYRRLDHLAIFIMIAGTYTPFCFMYLEGAWLWSIIGVQWGLVVFGLFFKLIFFTAPRIISTAIYVLMGWVAVVPAYKLYRVMPTGAIILILGGGLAYTAGAVIYAKKRPDPIPGFFGFHEIFHVLILAAAGLHFWAVYVYMA